MSKEERVEKRLKDIGTRFYEEFLNYKAEICTRKNDKDEPIPETSEERRKVFVYKFRLENRYKKKHGLSGSDFIKSLRLARR